jgi:hypothetical protein
MSTERDNLIIKLREKIERRKKNIPVIKPNYKTKLIFLTLDGSSINIHTLNEDSAKIALMFALNIKDLISKLASDWTITSPPKQWENIDDIIHDIFLKIQVLNVNKQLQELKADEDALSELLSEDFKTTEKLNSFLNKYN